STLYSQIHSYGIPGCQSEGLKCLQTGTQKSDHCTGLLADHCLSHSPVVHSVSSCGHNERILFSQDYDFQVKT
ncbi:hypothetical protein GBAR_LOCUS19282, partial [Geodia barretti]